MASIEGRRLVSGEWRYRGVTQRKGERWRTSWCVSREEAQEAILAMEERLGPRGHRGHAPTHERTLDRLEAHVDVIDREAALGVLKDAYRHWRAEGHNQHQHHYRNRKRARGVE